MYRFSIIGLDNPEFAERICTDIAEQYRARISDCALFCMTLTPEGTPPVDKASILSEKYDVFRDRLEQSGFSCGILIQASIGHGYALNSPSPFRRYVNLTDGKEQDVCCPYDPDFRAFFRKQTAVLARHRPRRTVSCSRSSGSGGSGATHKKVLHLCKRCDRGNSD